jgi:cyclohexadieny/prephenate dehydrogenase
MTLFNNISIIGIGLIGSSIAQAAKKNNICKIVSAFDLSQDSLDKAIQLGIIDSAHENLKSLVQNSDLVILCTPIGTYENIINEIAPCLKKDAILTDVGSVKKYPIEIVGKILNGSTNFVPAHPIAGSEKSGLLAGNVELFMGKQIIITPTKHSSKEATAKTTLFWQKLDGKVEEMDANEHDNIYATSSHIPHLISFCYANMLVKYYKKPLAEIIVDEGDEFASFVRLAYSNPQMWADIFIYNKEPIIANIEEYFQAPSLALLKGDFESQRLVIRLLNTQSSRKQMEKPSQFKKRMNTSSVATGILPQVIACLTIESVKEPKRVGGGFLGLTDNILNLQNDTALTIKNNIDDYNKAVNILSVEIQTLVQYIKDSGKKSIISYILQGANA